MITLSVSGLITAYILIAVLLLSINFYSNWSWQVKAGTIIITTIFYVITFMSFSPLLGWPTEGDPPEKFRLVAAHVLQPNKITGSEGAIYIWLTEIDDLRSDTAPRAYEFPYTSALHEIVINATTKLRKGMPQLGEFNKPDSTLVAKVEDPTHGGQKSLNMQFYDLPDPLFPEK